MAEHYYSTRSVLLAEDEEDGAAEAEPGPDEVEAEALLHVEHGERHEDGEGDDFLNDLELGERERAIADALRSVPAERNHILHVIRQGKSDFLESGLTSGQIRIY